MKFMKYLAALALLPALAFAQVKVSQLPAANPPTGLEQLPCVQAGATKACTLTQLHDFIHTNFLDLCRQSGIDASGTADSGAAVATAFATVAGAGKVVFINCPIKITIVSDPTKPIFVHDNTNVVFGPNGKFIVDNAYLAAFMMMGTQNSTWVDARFQYVGSLPVANNGATLGGAFNDGPMKTYMSTFLGNTFSGSGSALYTSPTNACAVLRITGSAKHITFIRPKFFVPDGVLPSSFIPVAVEIAPNWLPNTAVANNGQAVTSATAIVPSDVNFIDPVLDGIYMGFLGGGNVNIVNPLFLRYGDLQDSSGGNLGGVGTWFAPPHAVYLQMGDPSMNAAARIVNGNDQGVYVGPANRRSAGSGWALSLKIDISNGGLVDGWISKRPDGCVDFINNYNNPVGGVMRNVVCIGNSQTTDGAGGFWQIFRFPSVTPNCYYNINIENLTIIDQAVAPSNFPFALSTSTCNNNVSITGLKIFLNDWPAAQTGWAAPSFAGNGWKLQEELYFNQFNSLQGSRGSLGLQGSAACQNCNIDVTVVGWMLRPVTFSTAILIGATTLPPLAVAWPFDTGTYTVTFPSGESRSTSFTKTSTAVGAVTALTSAEPAAGSVATGSVAANWAGNKQRLLVNYTGGSVNTHAHVLDLTNAYEITADNGIAVETWTQSWNGSPAGTTAAGQALGISYPSNFAIDRSIVYGYTAPVGPTTMSLGWTGNTAALRTAIPLTGTPYSPLTAAVTLPTNPTSVVLYPVGANFAGTSGVMVSVRGVTLAAAQ